MFISCEESGSIIEKLLSESLDCDECFLILIGEKTKIDIENLINELNKHNLKFFGGIFPGIIYAGKRYESGIVVKKISVVDKPFMFNDMQNIDFNSDIITKLNSYNYPLTVVVLVDGLSANISSFLSGIFDKFGNSVRYIGGGAGSLSLQQQKCIFSNDGFSYDSAVVAFIKRKVKLGVRHGWQRLTGPVTASKVKKNIIKELNWENAFKAYKGIVESDSGKKIDKDNFFDIAKGYPFGIYKEKSEDIVRDPLAINDEGELICVGEVPENSVLYYLKGIPESLISAAKQAASDCKIDEKYTQIDCLVIDCISRVLFLENDFSKELEGVKEIYKSINNNLVLEGILTLGEISSYGTGLLEFFNKTIVSGVMYV